MPLLLMLSPSLLAAPVECETLETMHRAGVDSAYMVDLVMNSEIDAATVACLERGGVPAEVADAARYRMEQEAAVRESATAQATLLHEAAYDLAHGNSALAAQKSLALLYASQPNEFAAVIHSLATQPGIPVAYENWTYYYFPPSQVPGGVIMVSMESSNAVKWNANSVKGTLSLVCDLRTRSPFGVLHVPGVVFAETTQHDSTRRTHIMRARLTQEGAEPVEILYVSPTEDAADRINIRDVFILAKLTYAGPFIVEVNLDGHSPQILSFTNHGRYAPLFFVSACRD